MTVDATTDTSASTGQDGGASDSAGGQGTVTSILSGGDQQPADGAGSADGAGTGDAAPADGSPSEGTGGDAALEVTLPAGMTIDQEMLDGFTEVAKASGLTSENASAVAAWYGEQIAATEKAQKDEWSRTNQEWMETLKVDPEFGGQKFDATVAQAKAALVKFGGAELSTALETAGISNLPPLVRAFARIGAAIAEDTSDGSKGGGPPSASNQPDFGDMYPSIKEG